MEQPIVELTPSLLFDLQQRLGGDEQQALEALGTYLMTTPAGRALRRDLQSSACNRARDAA